MPMIVGDPAPEPDPELLDVVAVGFQEAAELAADNLQINSGKISLSGPPFDVRFALLPGEHWPEMGLLLLIGGTPILKITATEPRLHALFKQLEEGTG